MSFKRDLVVVAGIALAYGSCRGLVELGDAREITPQKIKVSEVYGFSGLKAGFDWVQGERAWICYGNSTIILDTPCDKEVYMASFGEGPVAPEQAQGELEKACDVLDCDGICRDWKKAGGQL